MLAMTPFILEALGDVSAVVVVLVVSFVMAESSTLPKAYCSASPAKPILTIAVTNNAAVMLTDFIVFSEVIIITDADALIDLWNILNNSVVEVRKSSIT